MRTFPIIEGVPILLNDENSLFSTADFLGGRVTTLPQESAVEKTVKRLLPQIGVNLRSRTNYSRFVELMTAISDPTVLVIGGSIPGNGMEPLLSNDRILVIDTDVSLAGRTVVVCDAHDLPFADCTFDGVVAQAVLEHVVDPWRCVDEIHRVLGADGIVYAETPFMQQVHGGRYDFTRFTPLGHRRLFRRFTELASGSGAGPATVLAWSYYYLLRGFAKTSRGKHVAAVVARLTGFWLKYLDRLILDRAGAQDGTWGYFFLGRKSDRVLDDRDLLALYRGLG